MICSAGLGAQRSRCNHPPFRALFSSCRLASIFLNAGRIKHLWPFLVTATTVLVLLLTGSHSVSGRQTDRNLAVAQVPLVSWRECTDLALRSLRPLVRHDSSDAVDEEGVASTASGFHRGPAPGSASSIILVQSRVTSMATAACSDLQQPTLVFTTVGGFGDRLKGMVTAFYAALLTHAEFRVSWTAPSPIAPYFDINPALLWEKKGESGMEAWYSDESAYVPAALHVDVPGAATVDVIDRFSFFTDPASNFVAGLAPPANGTVTVLRTNAPAWLEVVRHPSLRQVAALYGLTDLSRRDLFLLAIQAVLRRPAAAVAHAASEALPQPLQAAVSRSWGVGIRAAEGGAAGGQPGRRNHPTGGSVAVRLAHRHGGGSMVHDHSPATALIGVQIRTGGIGEAWTDSLHRHPVDSARCFADQALEWCLEVYRGTCVIFLTADSRAAALAFEVAFNGTGLTVVQTRGSILHTDRGVPASSRTSAAATPGRRAPADPWLKTYADWAALSQADVLLMSHSGYGLTAAWAGGVPHVRQLRQGGACEWVRLDDCAEVPA